MKENARLNEAIQETADGMLRLGVISKAEHVKITKRQIEATPSTAHPIPAKEIRAMRARANMSQSVFAQYLNVTAGYVSQLERGTKHPTGAALALLNVIRRKGIEVVL